MTTVPNRCVDPGATTDDDLLAYARGEAGPPVEGHVERCAACRARAAAYASAERVLLDRLFRRSCPETVVLGEYAMDILPPEQRRAIAEHLVECPFCLDESRGFRAFLAQPDAPPRPAGVLGALRRLIATPLRPTAPALAGLRGSGDSDSITYTAEGVRLTLSVQRAGRPGGGSIMVGLLEEGPEGGTANAALYRDDTLLQTEEVDDLGNFMFTGIPAGTYRVEVTLPPTTVVIDPVQVP